MTGPEPRALDEPEVELVPLQEETPRLIEMKVSWWDLCRSLSGTYDEAIVIFVNYEISIISEIARHIRSFADLSIVDMFTGDQVFYGAEYNQSSFQQGWLTLACCMYLTRVVIDCSRFVTKASSTPTSIVQTWSTGADSLSTTLVWLRIYDVVQFNAVVLALLLITVFIGDECFQAGKNEWGN